MEEDYLRRAFDYIEEHLYETIRLDELAGSGHISLMQLYREVYRVSGHSVKDYIRKRRVSSACTQIKNSGLSMTEIALRSGFDSLPSFSKVFKKIVGLPPMEYRRHPVFFTFPPLTLTVPTASSRVKVLAQRTLSGVSGIYFPAVSADMEQQAIHALLPAILHAQSSGYRYRIFGITSLQDTLPHPASYTLFIHSENHEYWRSSMAEAHFHSIVSGELTGGEFAMLSVPWNSDTNGAWDELCSGWLAASMFSLSGTHCREEFLLNAAGKVKGLRLCLPIVKKQSPALITISTLAEQRYIISCAAGAGAEERAAERLLKWIGKAGAGAPQLFYIQTGEDTYRCGAALPPNGDCPALDNGLSIEHLPEGLYAVMPAESYGDFSRLAETMLRWLRQESPYTQTGLPFALYTLNSSCEETGMLICIPVAEANG
ncbi:helix-turn-helix domain-containing protein [Paenibacillus tengchongensis]|uniref:helix-turn-helix domain-containing protein n=1 Tax=Paenibacillus tengchongensis TaxID=2608684 RepID=UPI00124E353B|nr:helix-turn-helix domain-containing protein [Paenibacillus tengchongensis]